LGALNYGKRWLFETSFAAFVLVFIFNDLTGSLMFLFYFLGAVFAVYYRVYEGKKLSLILPILTGYNLAGEYISLLMLTGSEGQIFGFFERYWYLFAILMSVMTFILYERICLIIMSYIKNRGLYVKKRRIA
jgi:hypothetical protein